jgi:uncharacterized protein YyaL (SSP411 family)
MAWVAARLWHLTGDEQYRERAQSILTAFAGEARRNPFAYGTLLSAGAFLEEAVQIVIVGEPASDRFLELHRIAAASPVPFRVILPLGAQEELPATHPAHGKRLVGGAATAYVCVGTVCEAPITEPGELRQRLAVAP